MVAIRTLDAAFGRPVLEEPTGVLEPVLEEPRALEPVEEDTTALEAVLEEAMATDEAVEEEDPAKRTVAVLEDTTAWLEAELEDTIAVAVELDTAAASTMTLTFIPALQ